MLTPKGKLRAEQAKIDFVKRYHREQRDLLLGQLVESHDDLSRINSARIYFLFSQKMEKNIRHFWQISLFTNPRWVDHLLASMFILACFWSGLSSTLSLPSNSLMRFNIA